MPTYRKWIRACPPRAATLALVLCLALAGCSSPVTATPTEVVSFVSPTPVPLSVTATPIPSPTDNATATLDAGASETPNLADTPAILLATGTPTAAPAGACTNNAHFVADVTVPDGTQFLPGQPIDKLWRVRNTGTCDWSADYRLVLVSGNALGAPSDVALYPARGGTEAILELNMLAPAEPGTYTGRWQARSPTAKLFGDRIFVTVNVVPITATVTVTGTATH